MGPQAKASSRRTRLRALWRRAVVPVAVPVLAVPVLAVPVLAGLILAHPGWAQQAGQAADIDAVRAELAEAFEAIGRYGAAERDEALAAIRAAMERLDERIETLEQRIRTEWADMSEARREAAAATMQDLRERRHRLSEAYGALAQGADSAWDDLIEGVRAGWSDLSSAWDDAVAALGDDSGQGD